MSILGLFDIGKSALFASQAALTVTSNNIANVNTPGYSRQSVVLTIADPVQSGAASVGRGVVNAGIARSYDAFLEAQLLGQSQSQGRSQAMGDAWGRIEQVLNEQAGTGLSRPLEEYFNAWNDVAVSPDSLVPRAVLLQKADALIRTAQTMENTIASTVKTTNAAIAEAASQINALAGEIAALNDRVRQVEAGRSGVTANDLRDQRGVKLAELSGLVDFTSYEDGSGSITVVVGMRNLVSGTGTNMMTTAADTGGDRSVSLDGMDITAEVRGGQLGGLIAARDDIQATALTGLRRLAASLTREVNALHSQGFGLDGSMGLDFFDPLQLTTVNNSAAAAVSASITSQAALTLDEYEVTFSGGNYSVANRQTGAVMLTGAYDPAGTSFALPGISATISGAVTNADSLIISPLASAVSGFRTALSDPRQAAASGTAAGVPGDNSRAIEISRLTGASVSDLGGTTFAGYYSSLVATVGAMKRTAGDSLSFDENLLAELKSRRDAVSSVSLDEEAANLLRYQRSYEAAARMISVADELFRTVLNL